jgi:tRNA dimethylallyltransferase
MTTEHNSKTLVVITGPTAVGKTETSLRIAGDLGAAIISADSRQFYSELKIGTAAPTPSELARAKHYLTGHLSIFDYFNARIFEDRALQLLEELFRESQYVILTGGSGLYIDAICEGIDEMPDVDPQIRTDVQQLFKTTGLEGLKIKLLEVDPEYYASVDKSNPNRMMRGIEIFLSTGRTFSSFRLKQVQPRPFNIKKIIINRPRRELSERINRRTEQMIQDGMIEEAVRFFKYRHLNALNTVGYKELYDWLENRVTLAQAIENIKTNTRRYAKRQVTWFKRYEDALWFHPAETKAIMRSITTR